MSAALPENLAQISAPSLCRGKNQISPSRFLFFRVRLTGKHADFLCILPHGG